MQLKVLLKVTEHEKLFKFVTFQDTKRTIVRSVVVFSKQITFISTYSMYTSESNCIWIGNIIISKVVFCLLRIGTHCWVICVKTYQLWQSLRSIHCILFLWILFSSCVRVQLSYQKCAIVCNKTMELKMTIHNLFLNIRYSIVSLESFIILFKAVYPWFFIILFTILDESYYMKVIFICKFIIAAFKETIKMIWIKVILILKL